MEVSILFFVPLKRKKSSVERSSLCGVGRIDGAGSGGGSDRRLLMLNVILMCGFAIVYLLSQSFPWPEGKWPTSIERTYIMFIG